MSDPSRVASALDQVIAEFFYRDEGEGLENGSRLLRCGECEHGWTVGGMFSSGPQHHVACRVPKLLEALAARVAPWEAPEPVEEFFRKLAANQVQLPEDAAKVLREHLWELYGPSSVSPEEPPQNQRAEDWRRAVSGGAD